MRKMLLGLWLLLLWRCHTASATPAEDLSPVFVWGVKIRHQPSLTVMSQTEFHDIMQPFLRDHMLIAFAEKDLTIPDFMRMNNVTHKPCFLEMRQIKTYAYFPRVVKPMATFHTLTTASFTHYPTSTQLQGDIYCQPGTAHTIYLPEIKNGTRVEELELHDRFIMNMTRRTFCKVVYMLMAGNRPDVGTYATMQRTKSQSTKSGKLLHSDRFNIYFTEMAIHDAHDNVQKLNASEVFVYHSEFSNKLEVVISTSAKNITFDVETIGSYYCIKRIAYGESKFNARDLEAPFKFSYYCAVVRLRAKHATLVWENLQFELYGQRQKEIRFSEPWHCTGFMSIGILAGLLVTALICTIAFCGVAWIMDVHTCDRYEDPKGKPLVIFVKE